MLGHVVQSGRQHEAGGVMPCYQYAVGLWCNASPAQQLHCFNKQSCVEFLATHDFMLIIQLCILPTWPFMSQEEALALFIVIQNQNVGAIHQLRYIAARQIPVSILRAAEG
jgi:hypothetical protein